MAKIITFLAAVALAVATPFAVRAQGDGFNETVRVIEQFYHVKHQSVSLIARAGVKAATTAAKIRGGEYKKLAEAGSIRVATFEEVTFDSHGDIASFKAMLQRGLGQDWSPFVQVLEPKTEEQNYVYLRDAGKNFHVLIITIDKHEAAVVQATVAPGILAQLLKNPEETGKALFDEATMSDP